MRLKLKRAAMCCLLVPFCISVTAQQYWQPVTRGLGTGSIDERVNALLNDTIHHVLYVAGTFKTMEDTIKVGGVVFWNGNNWFCNDTLHLQGTNYTNTATSLALYDGKIFIGGVGGVGYYNGINGKSGGSIGSFDGSVTSLCVYHDKLYAGGQFTSVNGVTAYRIACYDGVKWDSVGGGVYWSQACCSSVEAMCVWRDKLVVGGTFDRAVNPDGSEIPAGSIALWNDTSWSAIGEMTQQTTGVNTGYVYSAGVYKNDLIIGGQFDYVNNDTMYNITRYDGIKWHKLYKGIGEGVYCMTTHDTSLYVGGMFTSAVGVSEKIRRVARWDGAKWHSIDSSKLDGVVYALAVYDSVLYAGGYIPLAGKINPKNIVRLVPDTIHVGVTPSFISHPPFILIPNPVIDRLEMINGKLETGDVVTVTDLYGRVMERKEMMNPTSNFKLQTINYPSGMYLLSIKNKEGNSVAKFVKQ